MPAKKTTRPAKKPTLALVFHSLTDVSEHIKKPGTALPTQFVLSDALYKLEDVAVTGKHALVIPSGDTSATVKYRAIGQPSKLPIHVRLQLRGKRLHVTDVDAVAIS